MNQNGISFILRFRSRARTYVYVCIRIRIRIRIRIGDPLIIRLCFLLFLYVRYLHGHARRAAVSEILSIRETS